MSFTQGLSLSFISFIQDLPSSFMSFTQELPSSFISFTQEFPSSFISFTQGAGPGRVQAARRGVCRPWEGTSRQEGCVPALGGYRLPGGVYAAQGPLVAGQGPWG